MNGAFVDVHHHALYGIDDGPADKEAMMAMIDAAEGDGTGHIIATPHVVPGVERFDRDAYSEAIKAANAYCAEKGYNMRVLGGAEIMYTEATVRMLQDGGIPTLAGTRFVLVEWPDRVSRTSVISAVRQLANARYIPVIAHVERLRCFHGHIDVLEGLKEAFDIRLQIDADAITEYSRLFFNNTVHNLLKSGLVDYVASDAHDIHRRCSRMLQAYSRISMRYGEEAADAMMCTNPMEIIGEACAAG